MKEEKKFMGGNKGAEYGGLLISKIHRTRIMGNSRPSGIDPLLETGASPKLTLRPVTPITVTHFTAALVFRYPLTSYFQLLHSTLSFIAPWCFISALHSAYGKRKPLVFSFPVTIFCAFISLPKVVTYDIYLFWN